MNASLLTALDPQIPLARACDVLDSSRASHYRGRKPRPARTDLSRRALSVRRLADHERQAILDTVHQPEHADRAPAEIHAQMLSEGTYLGSLRTWHRVLAKAGESRERRRQRPPRREPMPSLTASQPNQVWTWDITKLAGAEKGIFYALYVIVDLFSRYVVRWMLADRESTALAKRFFDEAHEEQGIAPGQLTLHSDRGSPMKGLAQLVAALGVSGSFSRPRVSNDNPFVESLFKTTKYQPDFPRRFASLCHGRAWLDTFFGWYNYEHHHSALAFFTPADVHFGHVGGIARIRQLALDAAYLAHPERFVRGRPIVKLPPVEVHLNPIDPPVPTSTNASSTSS